MRLKSYHTGSFETFTVALLQSPALKTANRIKISKMSLTLPCAFTQTLLHFRASTIYTTEINSTKYCTKTRPAQGGRGSRSTVGFSDQKTQLAYSYILVPALEMLRTCPIQPHCRHGLHT